MNKHENAEEIFKPHNVTRRSALGLLIAASAALMSDPSSASATTVSDQDIKDAEAARDEAMAQLDEINDEYSQIAAELSETRAQIVDVSDAIAAKEEEIAAKEEEIADKEDEIEAKQDEIDAIQAELDEKQQSLSQMISSSYKEDSSTILDVMLSSKDFDELYNNIRYYKKVEESEQDLINEVKEIKALLETQKEELEAQKAELDAQKAELEAQKAELDAQKAELEELQALQEEQYEACQAKQIEAEELVQSLSDEVQKLIEKQEEELLEMQKAAEEARKQALAGATSGSYVLSGTGSLDDVLYSAYATASPGRNLCAAWVTNVFKNAGVGSYHGNACDLYWAWCYASVSNIQPGMIIAVPSSPSAMGRIYGHVGIYMGNGIVRNSEDGRAQDKALSTWTSYYGQLSTPLCGWLGGIALS